MNPIETTGLSRRFLRTAALQDVTFSLPAGSVSVLLGANGAGKTTLLKILAGLLAPTAGHARILGVDSQKLDPAQRSSVGYISENVTLPGHLTVQQFLDRWRPFYPTWDRATEERLLRDFDLPLDRRLRHLSRGMAMKVQMVGMLPFRPQLLLLDEPFGGLDPLVREQVVQSLADLAADAGSTVLVSSHEISEVENLVDHVVWIERGRLQLAESVASLQTRFRRVELELPEADHAFTPPSSAWAVERNGRRIHYVDSRFADSVVVPGTVAHALTLREIFVAGLRQACVAAAPTVTSRAA